MAARSTDWPLKSRSEHRIAFDREAPEAPGRHQGVDSLRGTWEAPGRPERTNWTACEAPGSL